MVRLGNRTYRGLKVCIYFWNLLYVPYAIVCLL